MRSLSLGAVLALMSVEVLSSPLGQASTPLPAAVTPAPTCTHTILKQPSFAQTCFNYSKTYTLTSYTNCGVGCTLTTERLGVGLPCRTVKSRLGATATVVTSCAKTTTKTITHTKYARPTVSRSL